MAASRQDIIGWFERGVAQGATHLIVVCDTYDHEDYPVYVEPGQDVRVIEKAHKGNMQQVMEVYHLGSDMDRQMAEHRAFNYEPLDKPAKTMKNQGLHQYRFKDNPEERRFAKAWEEANNHNTAYDTIDYLLSPDNNRPVSCSERDREVAATLIQWLGSPVGQEFLRSRGYVSSRSGAGPLVKCKVNPGNRIDGSTRIGE